MITVTLTTDWGTDGLYVGAFKGRLVSRIPGVQLVDISHQIDTLQPAKAALALQNSYHFFMVNSIHVLAVGGKLANLQHVQHICFQYKNHYFIGPNNGVWEMIFNEIPTNVYALPSALSSDKFNAFPELEIYIDALGKLAMGMQPNHLGERVECEKGRRISLPGLTPDGLQGEIIFFDGYGNALTNITKQEFEHARKKRPFSIRVGSMRPQTTTDKIAVNYNDFERRDSIMALFSFSGFMEIALPNNSFKTHFSHVDKHTKITVRFYESEAEKERDLL
ncbi:MAG: SAM-dependent chlorinase/fluorinase [Bacteroidetes bacterium]|nr:SAM-dependent chlorinase/fluorinase [Bacteroidota bacterium]MCL2328157.1 SAM-dependent chlorinase/fluorinase [Bacteroidota bacterium]